MLSHDVPIIKQEDIFRPGEDVYIQLSTQFPDFIGVLHKHTFIEIVYVISGAGIHQVEDRRAAATKGDVFIINYDTPHCFLIGEHEKEPFVAYDLLFTPKFLDSSLINNVKLESVTSSFLFYSLFPEQQIGPDIHITGHSYNVFGDIFKKIYDEFHNQENGYLDIIRAYLVELIINMFRKMGGTASSESVSRQEQIVNTTLAYLRKNYQKHISLDDLAAQVFLSKDYFTRLFRETTGMPINSLLQEIRISEACTLLTTTNKKVHTISDQCGFNDIKYFYNVFKKITGLTPGQYRSQETGAPAE